jgi:hypothetical protein
MEEFRPFNEVVFGLGAQYDTEVIGTRIGAVGWSLDVTNTGTTTGPRDDATFRLAGTPEVVQGNQPLIRMGGPSWRHVSALAAGSYDNFIAGTTAAGKLAQCVLDLDALMPGAMINGGGSSRTGAVKVFFRGTFGALTDYGASGNTAHAGRLRPFVTTSPFDPDAGFLRPAIREFNVDLSSDASDIQHKIDFEEDTMLLGMFYRTVDAAEPAGVNVDGLVKNIRVDVNRGSGGQMELARYTWGQLKLLTAHRAGFTAADITNAVGTALVPMIDRANQDRGSAVLMRKGDSVTMHHDTLAAAEAQFSDITPAAGDHAVVTVLGFTRVAGAGDQGAASVVRTGTSVNARSRRRFKRRSGR